MDLQQIFDAMCEAGRNTRKGYHLTLGELRTSLAAYSDLTPVTVDRGGGVGREMSYRGYYDDLAFEPIDTPTTVADVSQACLRALSQEYTGYKGGEYRYGDDTPLWLASYGTTGAAIVGVVPVGDGLQLITKDTD
jgi:hypothetical protein